MKSWALIPLIIVIALSTGCEPRPHTYPYVWHLRGAVVSVGETRFQVLYKTGEIVDLQFDDQTVFVKNKQPASWHSLLHWTRVVVEVETVQRGVFRARQVEIFGGGRPW